MAKLPEDRYQSAGDLGRAAVAAAREHSLPDVQGSVAVGQAAPTIVHGDEATSVRTRPQGSPAATTAGATAVATQGGAGQTATTVDGHGGPGGPPPDQAGRRKPPIALIGGGIALLVAVVVGIVVLSSSSSSPSGGADPKQEVQAAATAYFAASGASTCDLVTPAFIARDYKDLADCRDTLSTAPSQNVVGPHLTSVTGTRATDSFKVSDGDHYSLVLVKQGDKWLVDEAVDDTSDAKDAANAYARSKGSEVCDLVTDRLKKASYGGAGCEASTEQYKAFKAYGHHVTATSTRATDKLTLAGVPTTLTLVKVNDVWLVDTDTNLE
jgi:hypothetical protein